eukprot:TRINITY_DN10264_c0_g1_i1.p1 TRINITY_DN10264_c0_g1~~TRINITY_DN10264_c0_g1_i1.p1  ORF type:complete len:340 (+),score=106.92 TRINITY_DN10264_c0_g1_i1:54-1073(+)
MAIRGLFCLLMALLAAPAAADVIPGDLKYFVTSTGGADRPYWEPGEQVIVVLLGDDFTAGASRVFAVFPPATHCDTPLNEALYQTLITSAVQQFSLPPVRVLYNAELTVCYESATPGFFFTASSAEHQPPSPLWVTPSCLGLMDVDATTPGQTGYITDGSPPDALHPVKPRECEYQIRGPTGCKLWLIFDRMDLHHCGADGGPYIRVDGDPAYDGPACDGQTLHVPKDDVRVKFVIGSNANLMTGTGFSMMWVFHCTKTLTKSPSMTATPAPTVTPTRSNTPTDDVPCDSELRKWVCPEDTFMLATEEECPAAGHPTCDRIRACTAEYLETKCMPAPPS